MDEEFDCACTAGIAIYSVWMSLIIRRVAKRFGDVVLEIEVFEGTIFGKLQDQLKLMLHLPPLGVQCITHNDQANLPGAAGQRKQILPNTPPGSTGSG